MGGRHRKDDTGDPGRQFVAVYVVFVCLKAWGGAFGIGIQCIRAASPPKHTSTTYPEVSEMVLWDTATLPLFVCFIEGIEEIRRGNNFNVPRVFAAF